MKNNESIRIAVAETSVIIRSGLTLALKRLPNLKIQPVELLSVEALNDCLRTQFPDILVVNPTFGDFFDVARFREETAGKGIRVVALVSSFIDASLLSKYDASFSIFDDLEALANKINLLQNIEPEEEEDSRVAWQSLKRYIQMPTQAPLVRLSMKSLSFAKGQTKDNKWPRFPR